MHPLQDAGGGGRQTVGPPGPLVHQRLLAGGERLVDVLAFVGQLLEEVVELREARLQVLQLEHDPAELFVAALRGVRGGDRPGDGLAQQRELGGELGPALQGEEFLAPGLQCGPGAVDPAHDLADPLQDAGAHLGVTDVERTDDLGDHLEALGLLGDAFADGGGGADRLQRLGVLDQPLHLGVVAVEGVLLLQEGHRAPAGGGDLLVEALLDHVDPLAVHVTHLAQRGGLTLGAAQFGQTGHPALRRPRGLAPGSTDERGGLLLGLGEGLGGLPGQGLDGLEFVQHPFRGAAHLVQRSGEVAQFLVAEPVEPVQDPTAGGDDRLEHLGGGPHVLGDP